MGVCLEEVVLEVVLEVVVAVVPPVIQEVVLEVAAEVLQVDSLEEEALEVPVVVPEEEVQVSGVVDHLLHREVVPQADLPLLLAEVALFQIEGDHQVGPLVVYGEEDHQVEVVEEALQEEKQNQDGVVDLVDL
mmetsp:Transcript_74585/g.112382  ORF Transcript_74585/g.112382 Transcript_74585/m.112382 type:complete len:133 (+) Transcript_74585:1042-1440(+)|eukprot:CAMPEP_0117027480 /NCGR_PEP_ID=MMETSP0472-20121206/20082_1 /TAXON_ID=693140 ORGANISM="Tiarina fusus, Strain LIS" /NCGR_SAMPLE_ID=MMETSP0472 /ASSEMBLY_ACC=CAM_ASM_000603 /LENGTH=132 /DNA_ID=CAMNT_0004734735 /DNA_START=1031 /DNA_END=1429 /DNA_ORIENTATION=-